MDYTRTELKDAITWAQDLGLQLTRLEAGKKDCTKTNFLIKDRQDAENWIRNNGNLGIFPGTNMLVVDVDVKDGKPGKESYKRLRLPPTRTVQTPSGGRHFYFSYDPAKCKKIKKNYDDYPGIDFLTGLLNTVLPGSVLANGVDANYTLVHDLPVAEVPPALLEELRTSSIHESSDHEPMPFSRLEEIVLKLNHPDDLPYDDWVMVMMAIHHETEGSEEGRDLAYRWSCKYPGFSEHQFNKKWNSFHRETESPVTGATLIDRLQKQPIVFSDVRGEYAPLKRVASASVGQQIADLPAHPEPENVVALDVRLPGLCGEIQDWANQWAMFDNPKMVQLIALHAMSAVMGNRVIGKGDIGLNLFSMLVVPTGGGKESIRQGVSRIVGRYVPSVMATVGQREIAQDTMVDRVASGPGLVNMIHRHRNRVWMPDEFGMFLLSASKPGNTLEVVAAFMSCVANARGKIHSQQYSRAEHSTPTVNLPYLNVLGTTTPESLAEAMQGSRLAEHGLINRAFIVYSPEKGARRRNRGKKKLPKALKASLKRFCDELSAYTPDKPLEIPVDQDADDLLWAFSEKCDAMTGMEAVLFSRAAEQAWKLSSILAAGMTEKRVTKSIAQWAIRKVSAGYRSFEDISDEFMHTDVVGIQKWKRVEDNIARLVGVPPKRMKLEEGSEAWEAWKEGFIVQVDLARALHISQKELSQLLDDLEDQGRAICVEAANKTNRKVKMIRIIE